MSAVTRNLNYDSINFKYPIEYDNIESDAKVVTNIHEITNDYKFLCAGGLYALTSEGKIYEFSTGQLHDAGINPSDVNDDTLCVSNDIWIALCIGKSVYVYSYGNYLLTMNIDHVLTKNNADLFIIEDDCHPKIFVYVYDNISIYIYYKTYYVYGKNISENKLYKYIINLNINISSDVDRYFSIKAYGYILKYNIYFIVYDINNNAFIFAYSFVNEKLIDIYYLNENYKNVNNLKSKLVSIEVSNEITEFSYLSLNTNNYIYLMNTQNDVYKYPISSSYKFVKSNVLCIKNNDHYILKYDNNTYRINLADDVEYMYYTFNDNKIYYKLCPISNEDTPTTSTNTIDITNGIQHYLACLSKKINQIEQRLNTYKSAQPL